MSEEEAEKFFKDADCGCVGIKQWGEYWGQFTVEDLYQAFKARYEAEKLAEAQEADDGQE